MLKTNEYTSARRSGLSSRSLFVNRSPGLREATRGATSSQNKRKQSSSAKSATLHFITLTSGGAFGCSRAVSRAQDAPATAAASAHGVQPGFESLALMRSISNVIAWATCASSGAVAEGLEIGTPTAEPSRSVTLMRSPGLGRRVSELMLTGPQAA